MKYSLSVAVIATALAGCSSDPREVALDIFNESCTAYSSSAFEKAVNSSNPDEAIRALSVYGSVINAGSEDTVQPLDDFLDLTNIEAGTVFCQLSAEEAEQFALPLWKNYEPTLVIETEGSDLDFIPEGLPVNGFYLLGNNLSELSGLSRLIFKAGEIPPLMDAHLVIGGTATGASLPNEWNVELVAEEPFTAFVRGPDDGGHMASLGGLLDLEHFSMIMVPDQGLLPLKEKIPESTAFCQNLGQGTQAFETDVIMASEDRWIPRPKEAVCGDGDMPFYFWVSGLNG